MNNLIVKNEKFGQLEIYVDEKGKVWFPATEVAEMLGYKNPHKAILDHCKEHGVTFREVIANTGFGASRQNKKYINEGNIIRLITKSQLKGAEEFESWIFDEVVPSVIKKGMYATEELLDNPDLFIQILTDLKNTREEKKKLLGEMEIQKQMIEEHKPQLEYLDTILQSEGTVTITQIASDYDISAIALNKKLHEYGLIRKVNDQWILYTEHMGKGYTDSETILIKYKDKETGEDKEKTKMNTKWTQKGRIKIHEILTGVGIKAKMDSEGKRA